jgi:hypothetical protein
MRRVIPFIPSSLETCAPPFEGAYVCAPTNHVVRGRAHPVCASNGGRARTRPSAGHAPLLWSPLSRGRPYARARPFTMGALGCVCLMAIRAPRSRPTRRLRSPPFAPHETCTPIEAVRALLRARLLSISSSKLLFILPLGHLGLQLP